MKILLHHLINATVLFSMALVSFSALASSGYISDAAGSVSISIDKDAPRVADINDTIASGSVIRTGESSYAVLKFEDGQIANLEADTTFMVRDYSFIPQKIKESNSAFTLFKGAMRFVSGLIGKQNPAAFRLATPNATIGIKGTDFLVSIKHGQLYVKVLSGSVKLTNAGGTATFTAGQTALVTSTTFTPSLIAATAIPEGTFTGAIAINLEEALAAQAAQAAAAQAAAAQAAQVAAARAAAAKTAGGAATGGAAPAATAAATAGTGISATTIALGVGVAAGVAALVNATSATSH